jgi:hypothetical protein
VNGGPVAGSGVPNPRVGPAGAPSQTSSVPARPWPILTWLPGYQRRWLRADLLGARGPRVVLLDIEMSPDLDVEAADTLAECARGWRPRTASSGWPGSTAPSATCWSGYLESDGEATTRRMYPDIAHGVAAFERRG